MRRLLVIGRLRRILYPFYLEIPSTVWQEARLKESLLMQNCWNWKNISPNERHFSRAPHLNPSSHDFDGLRSKMPERVRASLRICKTVSKCLSVLTFNAKCFRTQKETRSSSALEARAVFTATKWETIAIPGMQEILWNLSIPSLVGDGMVLCGELHSENVNQILPKRTFRKNEVTQAS